MRQERTHAVGVRAEGEVGRLVSLPQRKPGHANSQGQHSIEEYEYGSVEYAKERCNRRSVCSCCTGSLKTQSSSHIRAYQDHQIGPRYGRLARPCLLVAVTHKAKAEKAKAEKAKEREMEETED